MSRVLIIGAGGVGRVVTHKCAQVPKVFTEIWLASRTLSKCDQIASEIKSTTIRTAQVDADQVPELVELIKRVKPELVINVALPYQDLTIMDACLETAVHYLDTANYEPPDEAKFEYKWQWAYQERFQAAGLTALLGSGFDPGVTNVFTAYALKHHFDRIHQVDILDCNAGDHGYPFATNFNPEINIREVTANGRFYEDGQWVETRPMQISRVFDFPEIGPRKMFLLYHEEMESLTKHIPVQRMRFWMTFGESYLKHLEVIQNLGLDSIQPIEFQGQQIVPLQFLKALLPDPATLGPRTKGKTNIGCIIKGEKSGQPVSRYIYNVCDHQACYRETQAQGVSYTTGVPAMIGAKMILQGKWRKPGVWNMEQYDPDPFMADLNRYGLPWQDLEFDIDIDTLPVDE
ncbi:MAG: saccharopine dehydrogenase [gamma proteobacterium symbiont of Stewartia floridana]|nr:MAG: saccharopine dehydrogenase [gamma proteobacterium symbiont of Stewartia floridana]RLW56065.1 MAG: saccharopine dehydrogenase [gamma proteobacterium symbiont of Stewartia floridana]RLW58949.1 MAG: saccharopine dehydrogenase [gamma proteobacterium symbiont of Stewartia floridana]RLW64775.1 MAG: saccharopine dehydrogenase [gamma proteobacterium symbiont of Stewartia floridana]RLW64845.1 MAG: saccharopine dehydrogenase [gamma proteobacterium symbiont of Stewartia floridana]